MGKTTSIYTALKEKSYNYQNEGIFYAFSNEQFEEGYNKVKHLLKDGEKLVRFYGGGYGTRQAVKEMYEFFDTVDKQIGEQCDPQDVYDYEFDNYECCLSHDEKPMRLVLCYFGEEKARAVKRRNAWYKIEQLLLDDLVVDIPGLTFDYKGTQRTPAQVWFDDNGKGYEMYDCTLYPVHTADGKQYEAEDKSWHNMIAYYKDGKLKNFSLE